MTEKKTDGSEYYEYKNNRWSPLQEPGYPLAPRIICGACGEVVPHGITDHDIVITHHCKADREFLDTMKKIAFKLLGIADQEEYQITTQSMMPQLTFGKEEIDREREEVFKEYSEEVKEAMNKQQKIQHKAMVDAGLIVPVKAKK